MGKKVEIKSDMLAEIRAEGSKIVSCIVEEPKVSPLSFSWEEVKEKGWEARRWGAAVAAMQGLLADGVRGVNSVTYNALMYADALVDAFKKEEKNGKVK